MNRSLLAASLALAAAWPNPAAANLPPGLSGSWYNPDQPGHGLSIQMLENDRALGFWYVFDVDGRPMHLYIEGEVVGQRLEGTAYLGHGMRFGAFDPAGLEVDMWGSVTLDFSTCDQATLSWNPTGPAGASGFEPGSMVVRPLVSVAGVRCDFGATGAVPAGLLVGRHDSDRWRSRGGAVARAMVDTDGQIWGIAGEYVLEPTGTPFNPSPQVYRGELVDIRPTVATLRLTAWDNSGWGAAITRNSDPVAPRTLNLPMAIGAPRGDDPSLDGPGALLSGVGVAGIGFLPGEDADYALRLNTPGAPAPVQEVTRLGQIAGSYRFEAREQLFHTPVEVVIGGLGDVCVKGLLDDGSCEIEGEIRLRAGDGYRLAFDVELRDATHPHRPYRGVGWLEAGPDPALVLVTTREDRAMGFVLREEG